MWGLTGNERAVAALSRSLAGESPPHAYLFVGPERVGKGTLALRLAQAVNCERVVEAGASTYGNHGNQGNNTNYEDHGNHENTIGARPSLPDVAQGPGPEAGPCGECGQCHRIEAGIHADVQAVTIEQMEEGPQRKAITIGQVREVERAVALNPFEGRARVIIIDPADEMTVEAQNAFLKTLEEPPPHVVFILVATREDRLLPTVHSRCRRIEFRLLPIEMVERALLDSGVEPAQARPLARLSRGRPGWALAMVRDPSRLERRRQELDVARAICRWTIAERMDLAERLTADFRDRRDSLFETIDEWRGWWRDVFLVQSGAEDGVANIDLIDALREDAGTYKATDVLAFLRALGDASEYLQQNVGARLVLEALLLEAPATTAASPSRP